MTPHHEHTLPLAVIAADAVNVDAFESFYEPAETMPDDLDADPEPDSVTPGFAVKRHRSGHWMMTINGECHRFFRDFEAASRACAEAEADWQSMWAALPAPPEEPRPSAFEGHPAQEGA